MWANVILAGKCDSHHNSTTSFSENVVVKKTSYQMLGILSFSNIGTGLYLIQHQGVGSWEGEETLLSPSFFPPPFPIYFVILWSEKQFCFCNGLKTRVNLKHQSKEPILTFTAISHVSQLCILEKKTGFRKVIKNGNNGMQDFCEKGVGMRNQNPPSRPSIFIISSIIIICMSQ